MKVSALALIKRTAAVSFGLLLVLFTSFMHLAATQPTQAHAMGDMEHHGSMSVTCATLCTSAVVKRQGALEDVQREQDDDLQPTPIVPQLSRAFFESLYPTNIPDIEPPGKIPLYKLNVVFLS